MKNSLSLTARKRWHLNIYYLNGVYVCKACIIIRLGEPRQSYLPSIPLLPRWQKRYYGSMEYRLQSMYNHTVGRTASVVSPFYAPCHKRYYGSIATTTTTLRSNIYFYWNF